jgi:hypothetical protein
VLGAGFACRVPALNDSDLTCRPIAEQFIADDVIATFDLAFDGEDVKLVEDTRYATGAGSKGTPLLTKETCAKPWPK